MRVTQSMLSNNMLRNLSNGYNKMGKLYEQIGSGKKINRPSDDPVIAMKGIGYRTTVNKIEQFKRNLGEVNNWLDSSDDALDHVGQVMHRARELMTNMPTDSLTQDDRDKIKSEIEQLRKQVQELANTKVGDKYIFSGTKTDEPLFKEGIMQEGDSFGKKVEIEVFDGVKLQVNTDTRDVFSEIDKTLDALSKAIDNPDFPSNMDGIEGFEDVEGYDDFIAKIDSNLDDVLMTRADIGARQNRVDMMKNRLETQEVISIKQMSENEDVDFAEAITEMITQESVHRASLSLGARIIQPTLMDFLR